MLKCHSPPPTCKHASLAELIWSSPYYTPPDLRSLQYFGRGLNRQQAEALQETQSALILTFAYPKDQVWDGLRSAVGLKRGGVQYLEGVSDGTFPHSPIPALAQPVGTQWNFY
jgi:hypothetical protein